MQVLNSIKELTICFYINTLNSSTKDQFYLIIFIICSNGNKINKHNYCLGFKYKKDSVMEVAKIDYNDCNSTRPSMFSNSGNTIFNLTRSGFFYFISGATGHCEKGQRMIVWVVGQDGSQGKTSDASSNNFLFSYGILFTFLCLHFV